MTVTLWKSVSAATACLLLAGCNLAPRHVTPPAPVAATYPADSKAGEPDAAAISATRIGYLDFFPDERLKTLIERGLADNRDLAIAIAQIAETRALYRVQRGDLLPGIAAEASSTRSRLPTVNTGAAPAIGNRHEVSIGVPGFELDFWGRIRNLSQAARSRYLASVAGERTSRLALIRSIASSYWTLREAEERLELAEQTVASRREGLRIARERLDAGVTSALDFRQAESLLTQALTELAGLRQAHAEARNLLTVLIGGPMPEDLPAPLLLAKQKPDYILAAGLPSDLLQARPDILAAEELLRAARANVGAARAAFFPSITLTGNLGYASSDLDDLFSSDGFTWTFGPRINLPIFDWGKRKGNVDVAIAREDQAVATYEKTVQQAFREVADALSGRRNLADEVAAQERAVDAQREIARLAEIRYREGVVNYLEVLDAQRNLFTAEQLLLTLRRQELSNLASLYAALGGGLPPS